MHSSSGVSSTGSLHLSIGSEWEDSTASTGTVVTATHIYRNLSASTPKDQNDIQNVPEKSKESMTNALVNKHGNNPPPVPPRTNQSHHVTTTYITQDEVTVSGASMSGATSLQTHPDSGVQIAVITNSGEAPKKKNEILKLREMLLSDNSVESSNVWEAVLEDEVDEVF